jgi:hypothetical protein
MKVRKKPQPKAKLEPKPPIPGLPRWRFGLYELKRTITGIVFAGIALAADNITQENISALWNHPGYAAGIALTITGLLKMAHQGFMDNTNKSET